MEQKNSPKANLQNFLIKELGSIEAAKRFVEEYKEIGIDVGNGDTIRFLSENNELLFTMVTYQQMGILHKMLELINKLKR